jgi:hypothetical protein
VESDRDWLKSQETIKKLLFINQRIAITLNIKEFFNYKKGLFWGEYILIILYLSILQQI